MEETKTEKKPFLTAPMAIVIAGILIAGAVYMKGPNGGGLAAVNQFKPEQKEAKVEPVTDADHILGNPAADLTIVEYSDTECPFCKNFHMVLKDIMNEYGKDGKVAWVYRQFPIQQLHSKAPKEAEATECAADIGGKAKFWDFINLVFERTNSNDSLAPAELPKIAGEIGLDVNAFNTCLSSGKYTQKIKDDITKAQTAGAEGTPYSVIIDKQGNTYPINGYVPYAEMKSVIDGILKGN